MKEVIKSKSETFGLLQELSQQVFLVIDACIKDH